MPRVHVAPGDEFRCLQSGRLQPVDPDRLLVADVVLETDVDIVAGGDHLLGGLCETRLIAIDRRDFGLPRQKRQQRKDQDDDDRAGIGRGRKVEQTAEPPLPGVARTAFGEAVLIPTGRHAGGP
jgi:hypothetical protein